MHVPLKITPSRFSVLQLTRFTGFSSVQDWSYVHADTSKSLVRVCENHVHSHS